MPEQRVTTPNSDYTLPGTPSTESPSSSSLELAAGPHLCLDCAGFVLNEDVDSDLWMGDDVWMNIRSNVSLNQLRAAAGSDCVLAQILLEDGFDIPETDSPVNWILCARFQDTEEPEMIGPFALWNRESSAIRLLSERSFAVCTPPG
jgi:hypothetical protein